ncbi:gamma-glutamylcyclotransferase [Phyllobacterium sp. 628]|uniref:gamma-glutamylcyclotransferase n=1 Tax=Phyllobacterium sp. 628 TaxID=2718938 RepID=UPI0016622C68|nr:gamma-glutamylcyclotransferase [Phyllobacterium sp. 628]QND51676.1 gamma-glutamylcyclotransferase [Phyllobacterium sp. 628]
MSGKEEHNKLDSDCTFPPDHPLPADQLGRYSAERDFHAERDIADYVEGQARGEETVLNVERVKTEYVMGAPYDIWDVHTDKDRWWVINNPTNLYSQKHFPSLDYTLSFHIGLMMRVMSRSERETKDESSPFSEVIRRQAQAAERLERAIEAVDFQAVGMQLRECLISLVSAARRRVELADDTERPKDADVVGWNRVIVSKLCPGEKNNELRGYMKAIVEKAWPLVNWLTHHRNANKTASLIALDAVDAIMNHYLRLLSREREDRSDQCPRCASRNLRTFFDIAITPDGAYYESCGVCGWDSHPGDSDEEDEAEAAEESHD